MSLMMEVAGWIGAALLILAYGLLSWQWLHARGIAYQGLNIAGSALILANSAYHHALPSIATNAFWMILGVWVLARPTGRRRTATR